MLWECGSDDRNKAPKDESESLLQAQVNFRKLGQPITIRHSPADWKAIAQYQL